MMILVGQLLTPPPRSAGALPKRRRLVFAVRDRAFLPGPPGIWYSDWFQVPSVVVSSADVDLRGLTPLVFLVKWVSFLNTLHWPVGNLDLGVGGISYVELLILYSFGLVSDFVWRRLTLVIFVQGVEFLCRLFLLVQA